jgi:hypothetical protein
MRIEKEADPTGRENNQSRQHDSPKGVQQREHTNDGMRTERRRVEKEWRELVGLLASAGGADRGASVVAARLPDGCLTIEIAPPVRFGLVQRRR